jgi:hypothetical protein
MLKLALMAFNLSNFCNALFYVKIIQRSLICSKNITTVLLIFKCKINIVQLEHEIF